MIGGTPIAMMQQNTMPFGMQPQARGFPQPPAFPQGQPRFAGQTQGVVPQPSFAPQPPQGMPRQPSTPSWQPQPANTGLAAAPSFPSSPQTPAPIVRGYAQEDAPPAPKLVSLPSPSALGILPAAQTSAAPKSAPSVPAPATPIDWNATHQRLRQLGAVGFHLDRAPEGGYRVLCVLTGHGKSTQAIEGVGPTEADAVAQAMSRAEAWRASR